MATKLVVTLEGLVLSNLKNIVSSRSIDEVILVGTPSNFNNLTDFASITTAKSDIASAKAGSTLSIAFADDASATLSENFYDYLASKDISFFVDSDLSSLSSSFIVEASNVKSGKIDSLNSFNKDTIANNIAYAGAGNLTLGSSLAQSYNFVFRQLFKRSRWSN